MSDSGHVYLIVLVGVLLAADASAIALDPWLHREAESQSQQFQQLVGGLGCGPCTDLGRCEYCFDPRLSAGCSRLNGPIVGGHLFCPFHSCSIFPCWPTASEGTASEGTASEGTVLDAKTN